MTIDVNIQLSHMMASDIGAMGDETAVIDTIYQSHGTADRNNLASLILQYFSISMDHGRIQKVLRKLINEGTIIDFKGALSLSPATLDSLLTTINTNEATQTVATNQWIADYEQLTGFVFTTPEELKCFKDTILEFIRRFFLTQGASSYGLITGDKHTDMSKVDEIVSKVVSQCTKLSSDSLVQYLTNFFARSTTNEQRSFLFQQFKKAVQYLSMVVSPETKNRLYEAFDGVVLYLDTSILYRAMNLQGINRYEAIMSLFSFCKDAKITLRVFQCTVEELKRRINYDARVIEKHPTPVSFSSIGYKARHEDNYISTFWKEQSETGISASDFNFKYKDLLSQFDLLGIEIDEDSKLFSEEHKEKFNTLRPIVSKFGSFDIDDRKSESAVDHDTECMVLVEQMQKKNATTAIESKFLFLSSDWSLMRLQRHDQEYKNRTDIVVLPSQMMQILYLSTPSIEYYEAFIGMFASSRSLFGTSLLNNEQMQEIMGRVASYSQNPSFAERILRNQLIQNTFAAIEKEEERSSTIDEAIRDELAQMEIDLNKQTEIIKAKDNEIAKKEQELKREQKHRSVQTESLEQSKSRVENLEKRIADIEEKTRQTEGENTELLKYKAYAIETQIKKAKFKTLRAFIPGCLLILAGVVWIIISLLFLIPDTSHYVSFIIDWIRSGQDVGEISVDGAMGAIITLSLAATAGGFAIVRKGWKHMFNENLHKVQKEIDLKLND